MVRFMADEGLLGRETMIAHAIWLDDADITAIAASGASVVHNPVSNGKLGSGVARVRDLLTAGVNVALGTDGLTCNDSLDIFEVAKTAAIFSNLASPDPADWLTPSEVLHAATSAGRQALGDDTGGTIRPGNVADIVFLDPTSYSFVPRNDAVSQVVFSAKARDVTDVMVGGSFVLRNRAFPGASDTELHERVSRAALRFWDEARASLDAYGYLLPAVERAYEDAVEAIVSDSDTPYRLIPPVRR